MPLPTDPIGSIPRSPELTEAFGEFREGGLSSEDLDRRIDEAVRDTIRRFEDTGSPVVTDGEQAKPSFATYPIYGLENLAPDGVEILFADGHVRQLPGSSSDRFAALATPTASEKGRPRVLEVIREHARDDQRILVCVIDPIDPRVESPQEVPDRILETAERIPVERLGTTDDCGFSPFADDTSTGRDTAFAKIRARVEGTRLASEALGV